MPRVNRHKIRFREYVDSGLVFLEVKCKNNKGKTIKKRGRPKKNVEDEKSVVVHKRRRGRPHKNPLMDHLDTFEIFLKNSVNWDVNKSREEDLSGPDKL